MSEGRHVYICTRVCVLSKFRPLYYEVIRFQGGIFFARKVVPHSQFLHIHTCESETGIRVKVRLLVFQPASLVVLFRRSSYEKLDNESLVKDYLQQQRLERARARARVALEGCRMRQWLRGTCPLTKFQRF